MGCVCQSHKRPPPFCLLKGCLNWQQEKSPPICWQTTKPDSYFWEISCRCPADLPVSGIFCWQQAFFSVSWPLCPLYTFRNGGKEDNPCFTKQSIFSTFSHGNTEKPSAEPADGFLLFPGLTLPSTGYTKRCETPAERLLCPDTKADCQNFLKGRFL